MIECDCSVDSSEYESARCFATAIRKARKRYSCCECHEDIEPGKRYEHVTGIDCDGDAFGFRTCLPCAAIRKRYCPHGYIWGELAEAIKPCIGFDYRLPPSEIPDDSQETT